MRPSSKAKEFGKPVQSTTVNSNLETDRKVLNDLENTAKNIEKEITTF